MRFSHVTSLPHVCRPTMLNSCSSGRWRSLSGHRRRTSDSGCVAGRRCRAQWGRTGQLARFQPRRKRETAHEGRDANSMRSRVVVHVGCCCAHFWLVCAMSFVWALRVFRCPSARTQNITLMCSVMHAAVVMWSESVASVPFVASRCAWCAKRCRRVSARSQDHCGPRTRSWVFWIPQIDVLSGGRTGDAPFQLL